MTTENLIFKCGMVEGYLLGLANVPPSIQEAMESIAEGIIQISAIVNKPKTAIPDHNVEVNKMVKPEETSTVNRITELEKSTETAVVPAHSSDEEVTEESKPADDKKQRNAEIRRRYDAGESSEQLRIDYGFKCLQSVINAIRNDGGQVRAKGTKAPVPINKSIVDKVLPEAPFKEIEPDKLIAVHNEFAGTRADGFLMDADWGDIKRMRNNGLPPERIAKHYGVEDGYLAGFIDRMEKREQKQGNG